MTEITQARYRPGRTETLIWKFLAYMVGVVVGAGIFWVLAQAVKITIELIMVPWSVGFEIFLFRILDYAPWLLAVFVSGPLVSSGARVVPKPYFLATLIFGRIPRVKGPGWVFLIPLIERVIEIPDTWVIQLHVDANNTNTKNGIAVNAAVNVYVRRSPLHLAKTVFDVQDWLVTVRAATEDAVRAVVSHHTLEELADTENLSEELTNLAAQYIGQFYGEVSAIRISDIVPVDVGLRAVLAEKTKQKLLAESKEFHAKVELQYIKLFTEAVKAVIPDITEEELLKKVMEIRRQETLRSLGGSNFLFKLPEEN